MKGEEGAGELNDEEVHSDDNDPDDEEGWVVKETSAEVLLVMDLPCGDHVDDLQPNEEVEDESHVTASVSIDIHVLSAFSLFSITNIIFNDCLIELITVEFVAAAWEYVVAVVEADLFTVITVVTEHLVGLWDHVLAAEEEDEKHNHLVKRHPNDVLGHLSRHNEVCLALGRALEEVRLGELSGESQRGQRIHDHVDPEKLNGLQRGLFQENGTDDGENQRVDVDGELELQETLDVIVNVSSPRGSLDHRSETVVHNDDIGGSLAHISSSHTHAEADIGLGKGWRVISSITSDSDDLTNVSEASDEQVLVLGS